MMLVLKITVFFFLALVAGAEKKIELQDIEEDNLKSEKEKDDEPESRSQTDQNSGLIPLEYLKSGFLRYFEPASTPQSRYVQQYAVTEQPERPPPPVAAPKSQYSAPAAQQAMVGYLSNVPMQIYLVPQYYNDNQDHTANAQNSVHYKSASAPQAPAYQTAPEAGQTQTNYIEVPTYIAPTAKTYVQQYSSPVAFVGYAPQPTTAPQPTIAPVLAYPVPVVQYQTAAVVAPTSPTKEYYQNAHYPDTNSVDEVHGNVDESPSQIDTTYHRAPAQEYTRFYPSRTPLRNEYRHSAVSELPHPNPLLLKSSPSHLSHIPKALPMYRPLPKPAYTPSSITPAFTARPAYAPSGIAPAFTPRPTYAPSGIAPAFTSRPADPYGPFYKRRPTSLLDSYIPSHIQVEYMKRGFAKDPLEAYEALSSGRHLIHSSVIPRHYERGFLPNQMYETANGGITFGHYKRAPKIDKVQGK